MRPRTWRAPERLVNESDGLFYVLTEQKKVFHSDLDGFISGKFPTILLAVRFGGLFTRLMLTNGLPTYIHPDEKIIGYAPIEAPPEPSAAIVRTRYRLVPSIFGDGLHFDTVAEFTDLCDSSNLPVPKLKRKWLKGYETYAYVDEQESIILYEICYLNVADPLNTIPTNGQYNE